MNILPLPPHLQSWALGLELPWWGEVQTSSEGAEKTQLEGRREQCYSQHFFLYWFCPSEPLGDLRKKQDLPTNDPRSQISFGSENKFWNIFQPEICGVKSWLRHWVISSWKYRVCSTGFLMPFIGFSRFLGWIYLRRPVGQGQHQQLSLHIRRGPWEAF